MRQVAIVGAGQTAYGDFPLKGVKELFTEAYFEAIDSIDKGFSPDMIEGAFVGSLSAGSGFQLGQLAPLLAGHVGLPHIPATRVENACASGGFAMVSAIDAVASGAYQVVIAAGVEKMRDVSSAQSKYWLGISGDTEYERLAGSTFAGIYAAMASRYMHEYGLTKEHLAMVAVKNHRNGALNPKAQFRREITLDKALKGPEVAYPLSMWDCCSTSDGAAVLVLCDAEIAGRFTDRPVKISGWGVGADYLAIHDRDSLTALQATRRAAKCAYGMARITPAEVDFAEIHDCFTIAEVLAYGDLGFCQEGESYRLLEEGDTTIEGRLPINPSGGLKAKGHPIGATGVGMACEIFHQLRQEVEPKSRQVKDARIGLSHNVGGSGGSAVVCIYQREGE